MRASRPEQLEVVPALERGLDRALAADPGRPLYALPTYTALLELRDVLTARGLAPPLLGMIDTAIWHDVECGSYTADLALWEALSGEGDAVLDLGCGTGRVALHLARCGRRVTGLDRDQQLLTTLELRTQLEGVQVDTVCADAREFDLGVQFDAVLAPMQLAQLLNGGRRTACDARMRCAPPAPRRAVRDDADGPRGRAARRRVRPARRRIRARWTAGCTRACPPRRTWSSSGTALRIQRLRTTVSPEGEESESVDEVRLELVSPDELEAEAAAGGLTVEQRRTIPATEHVGCVVVVASRAEAAL